jgi:hypothetical protein
MLTLNMDMTYSQATTKLNESPFVLRTSNISIKFIYAQQQLTATAVQKIKTALLDSLVALWASTKLHCVTQTCEM